MTTNHFEKLDELEKSLWEAADQLRANSRQASSEYFMPVLGVIFLRHASNRYEVARREIEEDQAAGRMPKRPLTQADFKKRRALLLPPAARYDYLLNLPKEANLGTGLKTAMEEIEDSFPPLKDQLPKDYGKLDGKLLEDLLRTFNSEALRTAPGDIFGRIYEYFLMKFSMQGAHDNGEFFTPPSLVQMIVNVIEPEHGTVFDPACGSGGMFVQSSHFIEGLGLETTHRVTFYGQEKTATTIRLAKMNLAVHALEGDIREANTFYEDAHSLYDKCDFVMANPPFNVDKVAEGGVKGDRRLPFGLPGVNKDKNVSNGNYLWISYFYSYLNETGRAGFVMSSQASSAGNKEAEVRRKLIETGAVDVMIAIRPNFFYTRTVPCELWHLDRSKPEQRRDQVLMIDARNVYRKVTRKIYDFSPEQLANLTAIVWLYRGEKGRFLKLVQRYLDQTIAEAAGIAAAAEGFRKSCEALARGTRAFLDTLAGDSPMREMRKERDEAARTCFDTLDRWTGRIAREWDEPCDEKLVAQKQLFGKLAKLAEACRDLVKEVDAVCTLATRLVDAAEKDGGAREHDEWDSRAIGRLEKELDASRHKLVEQLKQTAYFYRQAEWLLSRFPDAKFAAVPGLCCVVTRAQICAADWSLTPGRYVGASPPEVDEDFDFEQAMRDIHAELGDLNQQAAQLAESIQENFEGLGI